MQDAREAQRLASIWGDSIDLVLSWSATVPRGDNGAAESIRGLSLLTGITVTPPFKSAGPPPISSVLRTSTRVAHDFSQHVSCIVPVELLLKNCQCMGKLTLAVELNTPSAVPTASPQGKQSKGPEFLWVGATESLISHLGPQEVSVIKLSVVMATPGVYNLASYRIMVINEEGEKSSIYTPPFVHLVTVESP